MIQQGLMASYPGAVANTYATWNPSDKNANITLSGGNLIATGASGLWFSVRSTIGKSSGKWYWELTPNNSSQRIVGVSDSSLNLVSNNYVGSSSGSYGNYTDGSSTSERYNNGVNSIYGAIYGSGHIIGIALNMDAGEVTIYKNNVSQGVMYSGLTGTQFAGISIGNGNAFTANFGATTMAYTAPSGYNQGLYT